MPSGLLASRFAGAAGAIGSIASIGASAGLASIGCMSCARITLAALPQHNTISTPDNAARSNFVHNFMQAAYPRCQ
jgi:hypothetical protein